MKRLLVVFDPAEGCAAPVDLARGLAVPFDLLAFGHALTPNDIDAWRGLGAETVYVVDADPAPERIAAICAREVGEGTSLIGGSPVIDVLARVAGALDLPLVSDIERVEAAEDGPVFQCLAFGGRIRRTVRVDADRAVLSICTEGSHAIQPTGGQSAVVQIDPFESPGWPARIGSVSTVRRRPTLEDARVVVAGGRRLEDAGEFERYLGPVADKLGAALAASGGAVHGGVAAADLLIGQTGRTVAPDLYIAVGISGADQHVGGMQDSRVIVAINKDPHASIFRVADYGLVADFREALPELAEKL